MRSIVSLIAIVLAASTVTLGDASEQKATTVAKTKGLIAFWAFSLMHEGQWTSYHDPLVVEHGYPVVLRRIGDPKSYKPTDWPHTEEESRLVFDSSGHWDTQSGVICGTSVICLQHHSPRSSRSHWSSRQSDCSSRETN